MAAQIGLTTQTATILSGASVSNSIFLGASYLVGLMIPAGIVGNFLAFNASPDGGATWGELFNDLGQLLQAHIIGSSGSYVAIDPTYFRAIRSLQLVSMDNSGSFGTPVNQTSNVSLTLIQSL